MAWKINSCPKCGKNLWNRKDTGKYHCSRCKQAYVLTALEDYYTIRLRLGLFVRFRPMIVAECALRLGITSDAIRQAVRNAPDLYIWDGMVRAGAKPDHLS